ncbi:shikimate kinase, partial [Bacteroidota bacterium]
VFLKVDNWKLLERLSESSTERPMMKAKSGEDLKKWVTSLLEERNPFYRQADFVINPEIINPEHLTVIIKA